MIDKLVTMAKKGSVGEVEKLLASKDIEKLLNADAKTRFANRSSGFTRIIKLGKRLGDATEEVLLQFVDERMKAEVIKSDVKKAVPAKKARSPKSPKSLK